MNKNEAGEELKPGDEGYIPETEELEEEGEEGEDGDEEEGEKKIEKKVTEESPEARKARLERQLKQLEKKNPDLFKSIEKKTSKKSDDFDYGEKAFLIANGIKESDEMEFVRDVMKETGKSLDAVVGSKYFQAELKDRREDKATQDATPKGSKRSGQSAANTVEYWIAKGELPPKDQTELRRKVVNARITKETNKSMFTSNPVASNS